MTTDGVLRFVTVRPPQRSSPKRPARIDPLGAVDDIVDGVLTAVTAGRPLDQAMLEIGKMVLGAPGHAQHQSWSRLVDLRAVISEQVSSTPSTEDGHRSFVAGVQNALRDAYDDHSITLSGWLADDRTGELRKAIWRDYVANTLASWERPGEREELAWWIRALALMDAADAGSKPFALSAGQFRTTRPALPSSMFSRVTSPDPVTPIEPGEDGDNLDLVRRAVEERVRRYETALNELQEIARSKRSREDEPSGQPPRDDEPGGEGPVLRAFGTPTSRIPWRLVAADLEQHPELAAVLADLGIAPTSDIPTLVAFIEERLARAIAELFALSRRDTLVSRGHGLVHVERPLARPSDGPAVPRDGSPR